MTVNRAALDALLTATSDFADKIDEIIDDLDADEANAPEPVNIGDRVKVVNVVHSIVSWREGQIGTVRSFEGRNPVVLFDDGGQVAAAVTESVAPTPPTPTFKLAQRVKITGLSYYGADARGKIGVVTNPTFTSFSATPNLVEVKCEDYTYLFAPDRIEPAPEPPASPNLDIASMYDDRRIKLNPWGLGSGSGVEMTLSEPNTGKRVFAFFPKDKVREIIAALEANLA